MTDPGDPSPMEGFGEMLDRIILVAGRIFGLFLSGMFATMAWAEPKADTMVPAVVMSVACGAVGAWLAVVRK